MLGWRGLTLGLFILLFLTLNSPARAGPPTHLHNEALDIGGFNHACGVAVDSEGNVYVASAGESKIRIFDASHTELAFIPNPNEPCGLAVDSKGKLYVSEKATGKVVRYEPNAYPFVGPPTYGSPTTIDSSGDAKGIAVDRYDDRLYVAKGTSIDAYDAEGNLGIDEVQRVLVSEATGGTFKLTFDGQQTGPITWDAPHTDPGTPGVVDSVQEALEALATIGAGNVSVTQGPNASPRDHLVAFEGPLGHADLELLTGDPSGLVGGTDKLFIQERVKGFDGQIGTGKLTNATGVAAYTYKVSSETADRYVFAADDAAIDQVKLFSGADIRALSLRKTLAGPKAGEDFGFGAAGAYLAVDPGNRGGVEDKSCVSIAEQACTAGHFLVYDDAHEAVNEFEASGEFLDQFSAEGLVDAEPSAMAVDRSGGANDGTIYLSSGPGAGAEVFAFSPLVPPSRALLPELSRALASAQAVATDSFGNVYVGAGSNVHVYGPDGKELTVFPDAQIPVDLAVDSTCRVYVLDQGVGIGNEEVTYYEPNGGACPPTSDTTYSKSSQPIATRDSFAQNNAPLTGIAVNPVTDHVFVTTGGETIELGSAGEGSPILNPKFAGTLLLNTRQSIGVHGGSGNVYFGANPRLISVVDPGGTEILARITGAGSPQGLLSPNPIIAVDQSNGHVISFDKNDSAHTIREYDAAGGFVAEFGDFSSSGPGVSRLAVDPMSGTVYLAYDDNSVENPFDVSAFGPLSYGEAPLAGTGLASGVGAGNATLNGTVTPNGFELTECEFEYLTEAEYLSNGENFAGADEAPCVPGPAAIGNGEEPVAVHADLTGLDADARYRFRLVAANKYGQSVGKGGLFGPPVVIDKSALPVLYDEATLRANVDPSGLKTEYHFEYGKGTGEYNQSTPAVELSPGAGPSDVEAALTGLAEGTTYHFRIVADNEAKTVFGPDREFETLQRRPVEDCENAGYRTGLSANLPDCRAYELVTPAQTNGLSPYAANIGSAGEGFSNWLATPRGLGAGESIAYFTDGTLPGFDGNGFLDGYRAHRGPGAHPPEGWTSEIFAPSYVESAPSLLKSSTQIGVASDQLYSFWRILPEEPLAGTFPTGLYLRTPEGIAESQCSPQPSSHYELVGCGSLGTDFETKGNYIGPGGAHVIFTSSEHLEAEAAPPGTAAIYDRAAGTEPGADVVSLDPNGDPFAAGESASYVDATEDGSAIAFKVGGVLYLRRAGQTIEVAEAPNTFAGISEDGERVFYAAAASGQAPATIFACDVQAGPCAGLGAHAPVQIASDSIFVTVSADGSGVLFTSEQAIPATGENEAGEEAEAGEPNLYAWDAETGTPGFLAQLDPEDFENVSFGGIPGMNLGSWTTAINPGQSGGWASSPTRSAPGGEAFVFQSHAQLTAYDNEEFGEIYRYAPAAEPGERLLCVSCDPTGAPPSADAMLAEPNATGSVTARTIIPNITDGGGEVFFQSADRLLPEDTNSVIDVYEWKAKDVGSCQRPGGCLALISSGQGETPSTLYSMSADGHDVFIATLERLVSADVVGSDSIYDARRNGGIPEPEQEAICTGDACQGGGATPPPLPPPTTTGEGDGNFVPARKFRRCAKGKRRVKGRCVTKSQKGKRGKKSQRNNQQRRSSR